jgi:flagellar hook-associated protein 1 FlgK
MLRIGLSGLLAQQRALAITSNNIANATTEGYSRQRAELNERGTERVGPNFFGTGVQLGNLRRLSDELLAEQLRTATSSFGRSSIFAGLASQLDLLVADESTGLNITLQNFVNALQQVADDPGSVSARQAFLSEANTLVSRFTTIDNRVQELQSEVGGRISQTVNEINSLGQQIADLNQQILATGGAQTGSGAPDLLDQRDRLLGRLSELVAVDTVAQNDGSLSVFIGSGQVLVLGATASKLVATPGRFDPAQPEIAVDSGSGQTSITQFLSGGELGGLLDFRREMLAPLSANLGQIALGLADVFNAAHRNGLDLNGQLGTDLFAVPPPQAFGALTNTGSGAVAATVADVSAIEPAAYRLGFDGAAYTLTRVDNGLAVPLTGAGTGANPFLADGLSIVVSGSPAAGDEFLIDAVSGVPGGLGVLIGNPSQLAAAAPTRTRTSLANVGNASISAGSVADVTDPNLLSTATIAFIDPATYSINGAGSFAYTPGADILINGTRVQITGTPASGDQFVIEPNTGGAGDNRNALAIIGDLSSGVFGAGTTSLQSSVGRLVTNIGIQTANTQNQRDAEQVLVNQATESLDSVRGVNLDEEAADLLRYEQQYQAAAQTITVANSLFDSLIAAIRR